jgi:hypothetical protein
MIKAIFDKGDSKMLVLGLSDENIKRLRQDQAIHFDCKELGIKGIEVFIFTGETEEKMQKQLEEFIRPELRDGLNYPIYGPDSPASIEIPDTHCPVCNANLNGVSSSSEKKYPTKNDLTVCTVCTSFLIFTEDLQLRLLTTDEIADLPEEIRMKLIHTRELLK